MLNYRSGFCVWCAKMLNLRFEYGVILNGSQTHGDPSSALLEFEYGVILNGSQTSNSSNSSERLFEYGVILNGSQTL